MTADLGPEELGKADEAVTGNQLRLAESWPRVAYVENYEGDGRCGHCSRSNLKYVATLTDGSKVGLSCAKKLMGVDITPSEVKWAAGYTVEATFTEYRDVFALWVNKNGQTRTTRNGHLFSVGGQRQVWVKRGWL